MGTADPSGVFASRADSGFGHGAPVIIVDGSANGDRGNASFSARYVAAAGGEPCGRVYVPAYHSSAKVW